MTALVVAGMASQGTRAQAQAKADDPYEGLWQGYDGELRHAERQLIALAEATPEDKFTGGRHRAYAPPAKFICTSPRRVLSAQRYRPKDSR